MDNVLHLLGIARKAGRVEVGEEPVGASARARQARLILVASDAADNSARRAAHFAQAGKAPWFRVPYTKGELGGTVGRASCAMLALTDAGLAAALVDHFLDLQVDGLAGLLVAAFILKTGWEAAKDTLDPLLGRAMDPELAADIDKLVLSHPNILGIHDLVYHDYGPGRAMMSFHAEVPADTDLLEMHDIIDHIERELKAKHHIETVIHTDPVVNDERTNALREQVEAAAKALDPALSIHDLRITAGPYHTNVLFDVMVPYGFRLTDAQVTRELRQAVEALSEKYSAVIQVDHSYVERREDV